MGHHRLIQHAAFLTIVVVYAAAVGMVWAAYPAAIMVAAYARHGGRLTEPHVRRPGRVILTGPGR